MSAGVGSGSSVVDTGDSSTSLDVLPRPFLLFFFLIRAGPTSVTGPSSRDTWRSVSLGSCCSSSFSSVRVNITGTWVLSSASFASAGSFSARVLSSCPIGRGASPSSGDFGKREGAELCSESSSISGSITGVSEPSESFGTSLPLALPFLAFLRFNAFGSLKVL